jgi:hypothetical protein
MMHGDDDMIERIRLPNESKKTEKKVQPKAARTPKREPFVCVLVRVAAAGQEIKF